MVFRTRKDVFAFLGLTGALSAVAFTAVFAARAAIADDLATQVLAAEGVAATHAVVAGPSADAAAVLCPVEGGEDVRVGWQDDQGTRFPGYALDAGQRAALAALCAQVLAALPR